MFEDEMLTIDDLAAYLKLKPQTIYKWVQAGKLPGAKFGKEWRFRRSAIERWIDSYIPSGVKASGPERTPGPHRTGPQKAEETLPKVGESPEVRAAGRNATQPEPGSSPEKLGSGKKVSKPLKKIRGPESN